MEPAAGLGFSMAGRPGSDVESLLPARTPIPLPARFGDRQVSGEEKEFPGISRHLLPWMEVAVRAAKQDVRTVPILLDRARSMMHTQGRQAGWPFNADIHYRR